MDEPDLPSSNLWIVPSSDTIFQGYLHIMYNYWFLYSQASDVPLSPVWPHLWPRDSCPLVFAKPSLVPSGIKSLCLSSSGSSFSHVDRDTTPGIYNPLMIVSCLSTDPLMDFVALVSVFNLPYTALSCGPTWSSLQAFTSGAHTLSVLEPRFRCTHMGIHTEPPVPGVAIQYKISTAQRWILCTQFSNSPSFWAALTSSGAMRQRLAADHFPILMYTWVAFPCCLISTYHPVPQQRSYILDVGWLATWMDMGSSRNEVILRAFWVMAFMFLKEGPA